MSPRSRAALVVASVVPAALGVLAACGMLIAGDARMLAVTAALPAVVLAGGLVIAAVPLCILLVRLARESRARAVSSAADAAASAASDQERQQHRRFLARLDHELKNPITAIRATAAAREASGDDAWRTVDAQATRLSTLVRDLRKLAELETRPLDLETVDLEQLLRESIEALEPQHPATGARVSLTVTRVPWAVPPLLADLDLLALAIDNVLGNAAKYSATGPIEVRLREQDGHAVIEVADAGRGIPAADLPLVFDELARAQNARDVAGSGIGLTLVATVMRRHGGDVSIRSVEGAGSVVTLRVPIAR